MEWAASRYNSRSDHHILLLLTCYDGQTVHVFTLVIISTLSAGRFRMPDKAMLIYRLKTFVCVGHTVNKVGIQALVPSLSCLIHYEQSELGSLIII